MPMPLDAPLHSNGHPEGTGPGHPLPRVATDVAWPWEPPNPVAQVVPTHDMFVNPGLALAGLALGGIQQQCSAL